MKIEEILDKDGYLVYTTKGTSTMPLLRQDKDIVTIKKLDNNTPLNVYDVVLFKRKMMTTEPQKNICYSDNS